MLMAYPTRPCLTGVEQHRHHNLLDHLEHRQQLEHQRQPERQLQRLCVERQWQPLLRLQLLVVH